MASHDQIGDFVTSIRNASSALKEKTVSRFSNLKLHIAQILKQEGYIVDFRVYEEGKGHKFIELHLKFVQGSPAIVGIERFSRPGCRRYAGYSQVPRVLGGLGICILTTPKGVLHDREARRRKVGGEILCKVW